MPLRSRFAAVRAQPAGGHVQGAVREPMEWLLIEWPAEEPEPTQYGFATLPADTALRDLVWWAKLRWWVEPNDQQLRNELGLDHFEGRTWAGWHHHVTLTMTAFDFLVLEMLRSKKLLGGPSRRSDGCSSRFWLRGWASAPCVADRHEGFW